MSRVAALVALALCLARCSLLDSSQPLRTQQVDPGARVGCMKALATGTLEADRADPALVWLNAGGGRVDLSWPAGFRVRFTPEAEVLSLTREVVVREGQAVELGGGTVTDAFEICTINGVRWLTTEFHFIPAPT